MTARLRRCEPVKPTVQRWRRKHTLQRRIFLWLGATIVVSAVVTAGLVGLLSPTERMQRDADGWARFVSGRLEEVWEAPERRTAFIEDLHDDLHVVAVLYDASGAELHRAGGVCEDTWGNIRLTRRNGAALGHLEVCADAYRWGGWRSLIVFFAVLCVLWGASGVLARRLFRKLRELEEMASKLADGDLSVRSGLSPDRDGELGILGCTLDQMATRVDKQLADQRELLAAVSHELRTPLGHLRVLLEMAREHPAASVLDDAEREIIELDGLVGQLLASSKVDYGGLDLQPIDALTLARRALVRAELSETLLETEGRGALVELDPTLISRALDNLLRNAQQHGGGARRLNVRFEEREIVFAVEDAGPGFAAKDRERVFDAFYRGEHRAGGSLGLGLSLVARIATAHGGRAWIENIEGGGARVALSVSAIESPAPERTP